MPSSTFFRLSPEKRHKFLLAAYAEFSRVPYSEVSINQIILKAEISRGSFYQYFCDKNDLFLFLLSQPKRAATSALFSLLQECNGDLFTAFPRFFDILHNHSFYEAEPLFCQYLPALIRLNANQILTQMTSPGREQDIVQILAPHVHGLPTLPQEQTAVIHILCAVFSHSLLRAFQNPDAAHAIRTDLAFQLDFLKQHFNSSIPQKEANRL